MLGTIVNAAAIIGGSLIGLLFKGGIPNKYNDTIIKANGLSVLLIGIMSAIKTQNVLLVIFSMVIGSIIGEFLNIEDRLDHLGDFIGKKLGDNDGGIAKGFVTASLLFCVGSMAIVGALQSGLSGDHQTLFAKSVLDGITAIIFTSTLGIGVIFSAVAVFIYQGIITLAASGMKIFLIETVILEMSAIGGLLIIALGLNLLEIKRIKVGNMLPAMFIPLIYHIGKTIYLSLF